MSVSTRAEVRVYQADGGSWGDVPDEKDDVVLKTYWNDDPGEKVTLVVNGNERTVMARDLRAAITAVTAR